MAETAAETALGEFTNSPSLPELINSQPLTQRELINF